MGARRCHCYRLRLNCIIIAIHNVGSLTVTVTVTAGNLPALSAHNLERVNHNSNDSRFRFKIISVWNFRTRKAVVIRMVKDEFPKDEIQKNAILKERILRGCLLEDARNERLIRPELCTGVLENWSTRSLFAAAKGWRKFSRKRDEKGWNYLRRIWDSVQANKRRLLKQLKDLVPVSHTIECSIRLPCDVSFILKLVERKDVKSSTSNVVNWKFWCLRSFCDEQVRIWFHFGFKF